MFFAVGEQPKPKTLKEQLLEFNNKVKYTNATSVELLKAYNKVKALIDKHVQEDYIRNIFYERFLELKTWREVGLKCNGLKDSCVRKIVTRYIEKIERR